MAGACVGAVTTYTYDAENRLVRIDFPDLTTASYRYDGFGRRIEKNVNGVNTRYVYDREDILLEYDGTNTLLARYTHGPLIDEPLVMERDLDASGTFEAGEIFFYHTDGLVSVTELTDSTGAVARAYAYDAYGGIADEVGTFANPFTYTGREFDAESGLYFYRARYYDGSLGRFINEDPVGFAGGDVNLYGYVSNNPINFTDPLGLARHCAFYKQRCKNVGGTYYCTIAPKFCEDWTFPQNWTDCVRQCLQDRDCPPDPSCGGADESCIARVHAVCWTECYDKVYP